MFVKIAQSLLTPDIDYKMERGSGEERVKIFKKIEIKCLMLNYFHTLNINLESDIYGGRKGLNQKYFLGSGQI